MGLFRRGIVISHDPDKPLTWTKDGQDVGVTINPRLFLESVRKSFDSFVQKVREGSSPEKENFEQVFPRCIWRGDHDFTARRDRHNYCVSVQFLRQI